jgi:hypothetical protein
VFKLKRFLLERLPEWALGDAAVGVTHVLPDKAVARVCQRGSDTYIGIVSSRISQRKMNEVTKHKDMPKPKAGNRTSQIEAAVKSFIGAVWRGSLSGNNFPVYTRVSVADLRKLCAAYSDDAVLDLGVVRSLADHTDNCDGAANNFTASALIAFEHTTDAGNKLDDLPECVVLINPHVATCNYLPYAVYQKRAAWHSDFNKAVSGTPTNVAQFAAPQATRTVAQVADKVTAVLAKASKKPVVLLEEEDDDEEEVLG